MPWGINMNYFSQIIFPSKIKPIIKNILSSCKNSREVDAWVVGGNDSIKVLYAKCPICKFTYEVQNVLDESTMKKNLREYEPFYYNKFIRECPRAITHLEKSCQEIILTK